MSAKRLSTANADSESLSAELDGSRPCSAAMEESVTKSALGNGLGNEEFVDRKISISSLEENLKTDGVRPLESSQRRGRLLRGRITKNSLRNGLNKIVKGAFMTCSNECLPSDVKKSTDESPVVSKTSRPGDTNAESPVLEQDVGVPLVGINEAVEIIHLAPICVSGGINNILNKLQKKGKSGILEESKKSWGIFKKSRELAEEMETHNRGKHGYLERQDFLERTSLRQFEVDQKTRLSGGRKSR